jgi:hypothetical protein
VISQLNFFYSNVWFVWNLGPPCAFLLFSREVKASVREANPTLLPREVNTLIAQKWRELSLVEKQKYQQKVKELEEELAKTIPNWKELLQTRRDKKKRAPTTKRITPSVKQHTNKTTTMKNCSRKRNQTSRKRRQQNSLIHLFRSLKAANNALNNRFASFVSSQTDINLSSPTSHITPLQNTIEKYENTQK